MFEQLKQQFLTSFGVKKAHIEQALEQLDAQALTALVHQLAGASASYGLTAISELCSEIEVLVKDVPINVVAQEKTQHLIKLMEDQIMYAA